MRNVSASIGPDHRGGLSHEWREGTMLYRWRRSYCGIGISAAQSHKDLEQDHPLPQAAAAERMLNVDVLKALLTKTPASGREA